MAIQKAAQTEAAIRYNMLGLAKTLGFIQDDCDCDDLDDDIDENNEDQMQCANFCADYGYMDGWTLGNYRSDGSLDLSYLTDNYISEEDLAEATMVYEEATNIIANPGNYDCADEGKDYGDNLEEIFRDCEEEFKNTFGIDVNDIDGEFNYTDLR